MRTKYLNFGFSA